MLHYPKIPGSYNAPEGRCLAFEKYDGTNLHWEWDRDFGWHSFGPRREEFNLTEAGTQLFVQKHAHLRQSVELFLSGLAEGIDKVLRENANYKEFGGVKVFTEFLGKNSFAGLHKVNDPKELRLFDVWTDPSGFIGPKQFVADFGHLRCARVV
jgi:hypothetical protein